MKKLISAFIAVMMIFALSAVFVYAEGSADFSPEGDPLTYAVLSEEDNTVAVTGGEAGLTSITIPATVTYNDVTYKVTEIAESAFENYTTITELKFAPNSNLTAIRANAFSYNVKINPDVPAAITSLTFPASLVTVEDGAFHCIPVENFALEDGSKLTEIPCGFLAADGKDGYAGVDTESESFLDFIHMILFEFESFTPEEVAKACDCLKTIDFGDNNSLALIGPGSFKNQSHLTSIDFGKNPAAQSLAIASGAFVAVGNNGAAAEEGEALGGIDTLVLPANLTKLSEGQTDTNGSFSYARIKHLVFSDNCNLTEIPGGFMEIPGEGSNGHPGLHCDDNGTRWYYDDDIYSFIYDPVQIAANSLESIDFGNNNSLTSIGNGAFNNQSHLTDIVFGTSTATSLNIGSGAFIGAGNNGYLVEQNIETKLCSGIETLTLPARLTSLGIGAFDWANVKNLVFSNDCKLTSIPVHFLGISGAGNNGYPGMNSKKEFAADKAQLVSNSLETIEFGNNNSLTSIGNGAFYNQSHLKSIDFGTSKSSKLEICQGAFIGVGNNGYLVDSGVDTKLNSGIETLTFPARLTLLESGAFDYACIKNLVFSDNCKLKTIESNFLGISGAGNNGHPGQDYNGNFVKDQAQLAANSLKTIKFGNNNSLINIYGGAFRNQSHVTQIDFGTSSSMRINSGAFVGTGNNAYLFDEGADTALNSGIATLTIPANVSLDSGAFGYAGIKKLVFSSGSTLTTLPDGAFQNLDLMETLVLGNDFPVTTLKGGAFSNCDRLTSIDLSNSKITSIGDAIKENPKLTSITFPKTLQSITWSDTLEWKCPFFDCGNVNELNFANTDPAGYSFDEGVFQFLNKAGNVYLPDAATDAQINSYAAKLKAAGLVIGENNWKIKRERDKTPAEPSVEPVPEPTVTEDDPAGSTYGKLQFKASKVTEKSIKLTWKKVSGATSYILYASPCGNNFKYQKLATLKKTSTTVKKIAGAKLKKGKYYRFLLVAIDAKNNVLSTSKTVHAATTGGKVGNAKKVTTKAKKNKVTVKFKKKFKLAAKAVAASKKLKVKKHRALMYETSNAAIATVTKKGVIKGVKKGKCKVYAYAQNGVCAVITVTVK
ncbi:MAG: leucine-rich repeat protein [Eubacterium sp.]|nr:leucine-rich repeat protein [Eubacterium sp.]